MKRKEGPCAKPPHDHVDSFIFKNSTSYRALYVSGTKEVLVQLFQHMTSLLFQADLHLWELEK